MFRSITTSRGKQRTELVSKTLDKITSFEQVRELRNLLSEITCVDVTNTSAFDIDRNSARLLITFNDQSQDRLLCENLKLVVGMFGPSIVKSQQYTLITQLVSDAKVVEESRDDGLYRKVTFKGNSHYEMAVKKLPDVTSLQDAVDLATLLHQTKCIDIDRNKMQFTFSDGSISEIDYKDDPEYMAGFLGTVLTNKALTNYPEIEENMSEETKLIRKTVFENLNNEVQAAQEAPTGVVQSLGGLMRQASPSALPESANGCEAMDKRLCL